MDYSEIPLTGDISLHMPFSCVYNYYRTGVFAFMTSFLEIYILDAFSIAVSMESFGYSWHLAFLEIDLQFLHSKF